jgi:PAS domain S-box-containing protein
VVALAAAGLTLAGWWQSRTAVHRTAAARFEHLTERVQVELRQRFDEAALLLYGAAALPGASASITGADRAVYLRRVSAHLGNGVGGLGYAEKTARRDIDALESRLRAEGVPDFTVQRTGHDENLYVVTGIEPRERNAGVLGLDIGSDNTWREAAEAAAVQNAPALSRQIHLNYDGKLVPGLLFFLPVYQNGAPLETEAQRLAAVRGWVYAPIRIDRFMPEVAEAAGQQVDIDLFEGEHATVDKLLFDADEPREGQAGRPAGDEYLTSRAFSAVVPLELYGQHWTLWLRTRPEFDRIAFSFLPVTVVMLGLAFGGLATLLTWALVHARTQALTLAESMTVEVRRLAQLARHTGSGVVLTDPAGRVEWINEGFTRVFGFTLDEIRGRPADTITTGPDTDPETLQAIAAAVAARRSFVGEILNYTKDGRHVWIELEVQPLVGTAGRLEGFMALHLDITPRKQQAEQMRVAVEEAEKANLAKGQFLAMMTHEIRTPMNGVIGMTSLLLDSPLTPEQRESAETIKQSGETLLAILSDILDFSQIESGRLALEHGEFYLGDCIDGALNAVAPAAADKQIELLCDLTDELPAMVLGDPGRLRQVLVNLLGNAVKFTERGEVRLAVRAEARGPANVDLVFQVIDTGMGIPREAMDRLFKPFSQVDASLTRKFGGTGLGLVICRRLVELMGGRIGVESEPGRGSTFSFMFRAEVAPGEMVLPPRASPVLEGRRVLIVEPNESSRRILVALTGRWGMNPVAVGSALFALEQLQHEGKYDVALVNLRLPELDGPALAGRIRALPGRTGLPLIALAATGANEPAAGLFDALLRKPVRPHQLFEALVLAVSGRTRTVAPQGTTVPRAPVRTEAGQVLLVAADPAEQRAGLLELTRLGWPADAVDSGIAALKAAQRQHYEVIILDLRLADSGGLDAARRLRRELPAGRQPWLVALAGPASGAGREDPLAAGFDEVLEGGRWLQELPAALDRARTATRSRTSLRWIG